MIRDPVEESLEDLYEHAPCGYVSTTIEGNIVRANQTFVDWIGRPRDELYERTTLPELFTLGGRMHYETHVALMLRVHGSVREIAVDVRSAGGVIIPVLFNAVVRKVATSTGSIEIVRYTLLDATERRSYERELLDARRRAEEALEQVQRLRSLLPMCAWCRRVRSDAGYWQRVDEYLAEAGATVTHGICEECMSSEVGGATTADR